jgi:hypothetical protein
VTAAEEHEDGFRERDADLVPRLAWRLGSTQTRMENTELLQQLATLRGMYDQLFAQFQNSEERVLGLSEEKQVLKQRLAALEAQAQAGQGGELTSSGR